jgi:hypothetical protein
MTDAIEVKEEVKQAVDLNFGPRVVEKTIPYMGTNIGLHFYQATRSMRNRAMLEAVDAYHREHPGSKDGSGMGGDPTVLEKELACRMIKWWSLPRTPREMWDWLPVDLGDLIVEALDIKDLFAFKTEVKPDGTTATRLSEAAEVAKN